MALIKTDSKHYEDIANSIRAGLNNEDTLKPNEMGEKIIEVSSLKDKKPYVDTSGFTSLSYYFSDVTMNNETFNNGNNLYIFEKMDTSKVTNWIGTFRSNTTFTELPEFNSDSAEAARNIFYGCTRMVTSPNFNFSKITNANGIFAWCIKLETIKGILDVSNVTSLSESFAQCKNLKNIRFVEGSIKATISFSSSSLLTIESLKSIINGLCDYSGTENEGVHKLSLHADSKALLEAEGATAPNGLTWLEYISAKGWTY